jgi:hypothetical protein
MAGNRKFTLAASPEQGYSLEIDADQPLSLDFPGMGAMFRATFGKQ